MNPPDAPEADELALLLARVLDALERLVETTAEISAKLDRANAARAELNRSQWS